jgi:hypothetical protein
MTPKPPKAPWLHRALADPWVLKLYKMIGRPPLDFDWKGTHVEMRPLGEDGTAVKTTKTVRAKDVS